MKGNIWTILKWGLIVTAVVLVLAIILINFTSSRDLPELVRVQVERYAVCSYWFFGWHLASTGAFAFAFLLLGFLLGLGLAFFWVRRA
jgi:LPXTG-motif cell wall-anchored protein